MATSKASSEDLYGLSKDDIRILKQLVEEARSKRQNTVDHSGANRSWTEAQDYLTPEVYLAKSADLDGITAGSGASPGSADIEAYRVLATGNGSIEDAGFKKTVFDIGDDYGIILRDKFGQWLKLIASGVKLRTFCLIEDLIQTGTGTVYAKARDKVTGEEFYVMDPCGEAQGVAFEACGLAFSGRAAVMCPVGYRWWEWNGESWVAQDDCPTELGSSADPPSYSGTTEGETAETDCVSSCFGVIGKMTWQWARDGYGNLGWVSTSSCPSTTIVSSANPPDYDGTEEGETASTTCLTAVIEERWQIISLTCPGFKGCPDIFP